MASAADVAAAPPRSRADFGLSETSQSIIAMARWVSALVVVLAHLRALLFVGWSDLPAGSKTPVTLAFYSLTSFSHEAVIVFFVLSGVLVGGINAERASQGKFNIASFSVDRVTRIYVTLIPALLLTFVLDQLGARLFGWSGFYNEAQAMIAARFGALDVAHELSARQILGNVFMLQPVYVPVLGTNVPLWSLSYEVWFYVWFGIAALALSRSHIAGVVAACLGALVLALFFQWLAVYYLLIWSFGIAAYMWRGWPRNYLLPAVGILLCLGWAASGKNVMVIAGTVFYASDLPLGVTMAWLLSLTMTARLPLMLRMKPFNDVASDFSYSLYVIHFPTIVLLTCGISAVLGLSAQLPHGFALSDPREAVLYLSTIAAAVAIAFVYARLVERQTGPTRRAIKRRFAIR